FTSVRVRRPGVDGPMPAVRQAAPGEGRVEAGREEAEAKPPKNLVPIKSPMVGTFYRAPAPDADNYVEENSTVTVGQTVCILEAVVDQILTPKQKRTFEETKEVDFAFGVTGLSRFRSNFYQQRGTIAMVFRQVPATIPTFEELNLPPVIEEIASRPRGLVLVCGTVGSGKSTTLAAMIDTVNRTIARNVITIEDPVEFLYRDKKSTISQREVGLDTASFGEGLKHILRQDPDVILIGEVRDGETMQTALMAADTGHLVLTTLHTTDAAQTI